MPHLLIFQLEPRWLLRFLNCIFRLLSKQDIILPNQSFLLLNQSKQIESAKLKVDFQFLGFPCLVFFQHFWLSKLNQFDS